MNIRNIDNENYHFSNFAVKLSLLNDTFKYSETSLNRPALAPIKITGLEG
jgi:hypothetical protein